MYQAIKSFLIKMNYLRKNDTFVFSCDMHCVFLFSVLLAMCIRLIQPEIGGFIILFGLFFFILGCAVIPD